MELKKNILAEFKEFFINYKNVLTPQQYNFIKAVAKEKNVNAPTGNEFLSKYKLGAASTVISIITALLKKEIIYKESDSIFVYDVYLSRWLEEQ